MPSQRYSHGNFLYKHHSLVSPVQTLTASTRHTMYTKSNHPHFHNIPSVRRNFISHSFLMSTTMLWNSLLGECFRNQYNHKLFKSLVNRYLSYIICNSHRYLCYNLQFSSLSMFIICNSHRSHYTISFRNHLPCMNLGPCIRWIYIKRTCFPLSHLVWNPWPSMCGFSSSWRPACRSKIHRGNC